MPAEPIQIPKGSEIIFSGGGIDNSKVATVLKSGDGIRSMLSEDLAIDLSSSFSDLVTWRPPKEWGAVVNLFNSAMGVQIPSGNYKQFGYQVWERTEPVAVSFDVMFYMGMLGSKDRAAMDVTLPAAELMSLPLPYEDSNNQILGLVPPGPSLAAVFKVQANNGTKTGGSVKIRVGGFVMEDAIITSVKPTVARYATIDSQSSREIPIYIKLSISAQGIWTATKGQIRDWW